MFTSLRLRNFKAYRDSGPIPLKPLTVILGANNSGKSSLLHAILLLAQTLEDTTSRQPLVTSGSFVDLGGYFDILWGGQDGGATSFGIDLSASESSMLPFYSPGPDQVERPVDLQVTFTFEPERNAIVVSTASVSGRDGVWASARRSGRGYTVPHLSAAMRRWLDGGFRHFLPTLRLKRQPDFASRSRAESQAIDTYFRAEGATQTWTQALGLVQHVAPLRLPVPRFGILGKSPTSELGPGGENLLRVLRSYDDDSVVSGERLVDQVNSWISGRFGMLQRLKLVNVDEAGTVLALLGDERRGFRNINVANMGEGLSQLLPIVARVLTTPPDGSLLIEQPELHLHPGAQADLADLFIEGSQSGRRQYIVETHSEHLLLRLRRRIAEKVITPEEVAIIYVERGRQSSTLRALDLNREGSFDDWPESFFEERYREALAIVDASQPS